MTHRDFAYFEIVGQIVPMTASEAAYRVRSLPQITQWADIIGRRVTALFQFNTDAYMAFDDAFAQFSGGMDWAGVDVKKVSVKLPGKKPQKDKRSHQSRLRDALGGTVVSIEPIRLGVLFTLSNGAVVDLSADLEGPYLLGATHEEAEISPHD